MFIFALPRHPASSYQDLATCRRHYSIIEKIVQNESWTDGRMIACSMMDGRVDKDRDRTETGQIHDKDIYGRMGGVDGWT